MPRGTARQLSAIISRYPCRVHSWRLRLPLSLRFGYDARGVASHERNNDLEWVLVLSAAFNTALKLTAGGSLGPGFTCPFRTLSTWPLSMLMTTMSMAPSWFWQGSTVHNGVRFFIEGSLVLPYLAQCTLGHRSPILQTLHQLCLQKLLEFLVASSRNNLP